MFLLVGGDSEIGAATYLQLKAGGKAAAATTRRPQLASPDRPLLELAADLSSFEPAPDTSAALHLRRLRPAGGLRADPAGSAAINVRQTLALAERLTARNIYVFFLSSNQVFDGSVPMCAPTRASCPVSGYGRQRRGRAAARADARRRSDRHLRLAKVVSATACPSAAECGRCRQEPIRAFHDMQMAPAPTALVGVAIAALLEGRAPGVFQLTGPQDVSYADVAHRLARQLGADPALVGAVGAIEAGMPAGAAPRHTTLDSSALRDRFGIVAPGPWRRLDAVAQRA